jgi:hypothetical protein
MDTSIKEPSAAASFLAAKRLENTNYPLPGQVVLADECGDSLWDEVLAQEDSAVAIEKSLENNEGFNKIDKQR